MPAKKIKEGFSCKECGYFTLKWLGKCPSCGSWNAFHSTSLDKNAKKTKELEVVPKRLKEVASTPGERFSSDMDEFDRVLGGGLSNGSLTLLGGEPGVGKSTLLMEVCKGFARKKPNENILYVSGEECMSQVGDRAKRLGMEPDNLYLLNETSWQKIEVALKEIRPKLFILDSIQTTVSSEVLSPPGSLAQVREVTYELMNHTKAKGVCSLVIGHVTKDGAIAGPKTLEHMVDTVVYFEGQKEEELRLLRSIKNRFGPTHEVGLFKMKADGLMEASAPFPQAGSKTTADYGCAVTAVKEGSRPFLVEAQSLVLENQMGHGKKITQGVDSSRLGMLLAVADKYFEAPLSCNDVYLNVAGGLKLDSRDSDLAILASLLSSYKALPVQPNSVFVGEVGLTGEVRSPSSLEPALGEIVSRGFQHVITSKNCAQRFKSRFPLNFVGLEKASELLRLFK